MISGAFKTAEPTAETSY